MNTLDEAFDALEKQYPKPLCYYYDRAIRIRRDVCRRFLSDIEEEK
jgi:hypothetical protein